MQNETVNIDFPFLHYSVNYDYEYPITYAKLIHNQQELDEIAEECHTYGYEQIDDEEFARINKEFPNRFFSQH